MRNTLIYALATVLLLTMFCYAAPNSTNTPTTIPQTTVPITVPQSNAYTTVLPNSTATATTNVISPELKAVNADSTFYLVFALVIIAIIVILVDSDG